MKHLKFLSIVLAGTIFYLLPAAAQNKIPGDPDLIKGRLDNGMTYYIRHNGNPSGCADFYIVHNVGALQEEDNQNGLAHFLEHMAFNGTKHYPGKALLKFLEKDGVRFGYDVNAYTSRTETVYNISSVPLVRESFVDSVLLVLHDWSCDISCEQKDLDDERGVISEEWRRRDDQRTRMAMKQSDLLYNGSKHCRRSVLGTLEIINGFSRDEILDFYHKWYRPDLQAIIIVGDFDAEEMERKVRDRFSDIPAAVNPAQKEEYPIPAINGPLFENMTDPDISIYTLKMMIRQPVPERSLRSTDKYYKDLCTKMIAEEIIHDRIKAAAKRSDSPVKSAVFTCNPYGTDFYNNLFTLLPKGKDRLEDCLAFLERELKRCRDFGFTDEEVENARFQALKDMKLDKVQAPETILSEELVKVYVNSWLRGFPDTDPVTLADIRRNILDNVSAEEVQKAMQELLDSKERIYSYVINEKDAWLLPGEETMREIIAEVQNETLEPRYLTFSKVDLNVNVNSGKIVKEKKLKGTDAEIWTLDNGAKVWYTPSEPVNANSHLAMDIYFRTGHGSCAADPSAERFADSYIARYAGFRGLDGVELKNRPECYGISWLMSRHTSDRSLIRMSSDGKNVEKAFQAFHLLVTEPYLGSEKTFVRTRSNNISNLKKTKSNVQKFSDECKEIIYSSNPYSREIDTAVVAATDLDAVKHIYARHYTKFDDMQIFICSDADKDEIKEYVCKYIASLSGDYGKESKKTQPMLPSYKGKCDLITTCKATSSPKTQIQSRYKTTVRNGQKENAVLEMLDYILSDRYLNQIREKRGGTYHIAFMSERYGSKTDLVESVVEFQTRPVMKDVLLQDVDDVLETMCKEGPTGKEMEAAVRYFVKAEAKKREKARNSVSDKNAKTSRLVRFGESEAEDYEKLLHSITSDDVRRMALKISRGDRFLGVYTEE